VNDLINFTGDRQTNKQTDKQTDIITAQSRRICEPGLNNREIQLLKLKVILHQVDGDKVVVFLGNTEQRYSRVKLGT